MQYLKCLDVMMLFESICFMIIYVYISAPVLTDDFDLK